MSILRKMFFVFLAFLCLPAPAFEFTYEHLTSGWFTSIHVLVVDPKEHAIAPVKAEGLETVSTLTHRYGATAAINGGFFKSNGNPAGILKINHQWHGTPIKPRGAIGWSLGGQRVCIDQVLTTTNNDEIEIIPLHSSREEWKNLEHIVGGTPVLIRNKKLVEDYSSEQTLESFLVNKHPRTAVGIRDDGTWVFVVVDAFFYRLLGGMPLRELAELMLMLECAEALNLDGGSSSTMVLEGVVVNEPCGIILENGKLVEAVSDAILVFPDALLKH